MTAAVAIRHVAFEDLGLLEGLLTQRSVSARYLEAGLDEISPAVLGRFDVLIVLGGPIGVYEESTYPFLTEEIHICRLVGDNLLYSPVDGFGGVKDFSHFFHGLLHPPM